ncbi:MAG: hypothetical protein AB1656_02170 [Candidatus Omnitrophota bacterium]
MKLRWFPTLFWMWAIAVSVWIETASVGAPESHAYESFSSIRFTDMRFEQRKAQSSLLVIDAPITDFSSKTRLVKLESPRLAWSSGDKIFTATGTRGSFEINVSQTALPSNLSVLELKDGAHIEGKNSAVDSKRLLFDNNRRLFQLPESFVIRMANGSTGQSDGGYYYNPLTDELTPMETAKP